MTELFARAFDALWPRDRVGLDLWRAPWEMIREITVIDPEGLDPVQWRLPADRFPAHTRASARSIDFAPILGAAAGLAPDVREGLVRRAKRMVLLLALQEGVRGKATLHRPMSAATLAGHGRELVRQVVRRLEGGPPLLRSDDCQDGRVVFADLGADWWLEAGRHANLLRTRLAAIAPETALSDRPVEIRVAPAKAERAALENETAPYADDHLTAILVGAGEFSAMSADVGRLFLFDQEPLVGSRRGRVSERLDRFRAFRGAVLHSDYVFGWSPGQMVTGIAQEGDGPVWRFADTRSPGVAVRRLLGLAQAGNAFMAAFGAGLRPEELNGLPRDCLAAMEPGTGVLRGYRLKDSDAVRGEPRDWPMPELAVGAIQRQAALAGIVDPDGDGLWFAVRELRTGAKQFASMQAAAALGSLLDGEGRDLASGEPFNLRRIRASVARLVALSTQGAAHILYEVFGHDRIETTLGYMRAKGDLAEEIEAIEERLRRARIEEEVLGPAAAPDLAGGAAPAVGQMIEVVAEVARSFEAEAPGDGVAITGEEDIRLAAEVLGTAQLVRPGVLCRAIGSFRGACSEKVGTRDVARCVSSCTHRLETAAFAEDQRQAMLWHLDTLGMPDSNDDAFAREFARQGVLTVLAGCAGNETFLVDGRLRPVIQTLSGDERARLPEPVLGAIARLLEA